MSASPTTPDISKSPSGGELASIFGRFGNMTFGGGSATIAVIHQEIVSKRKWVSEEIFALCYALSRVTPGTNLLAFETGIGWVVRGWVGAIISLIAGSLPCSAVAVLVTFAYESFSQNVLVARAIRGALAATVGLMLVTSIQLLRPHVSRHQFVVPVTVCVVSFLLVWKVALPPVLVLGIAAVVGYFLPVRKTA